MDMKRVDRTSQQRRCQHHGIDPVIVMLGRLQHGRLLRCPQVCLPNLSQHWVTLPCNRRRLYVLDTSRGVGVASSNQPKMAIVITRDGALHRGETEVEIRIGRGIDGEALLNIRALHSWLACRRHTSRACWRWGREKVVRFRGKGRGRGSIRVRVLSYGFVHREKTSQLRSDIVTCFLIWHMARGCGCA
jgi:hypothetical protein